MYGSELAEIFDQIYAARGKDYRTEAEEIAGRVRSHLPGAASLLDVACGTGAHLSAFAEIFDRVEGLELSEPMIETARRRLPGVRIRAGDMRDLDLGTRFDAITCLTGSIGYLTTTEELDAALLRFARHLNPGGVVAIDPWWFLETFRPGYVSGDVVTVAGRTIARVSHSALEGNASRMHVHYVVAEAAAGARHFMEDHLITLFTRKEYEAAFTRAGLAVSYVEGVQSGRGLFLGVLTGADPAAGAVTREDT
ncbi:class I SAM-dependent methyltransferase [Micromonospora sp. NPDC049559]|uniref:class I SAM-dependent DNA methyltransferase n=1 Tax=Micromonospora sp. NPDC049559 TaxID=3155923 RepID=UPI00341F221B